MHPQIENVTRALNAAGIAGEVRVLPDSARTAAEAAAALCVDVGAIANSLVFDADGEAVLILTSGAHRVDTDKVADEQGIATLNRASAAFVRLSTGQAIGGVSPVGHPTQLRTFVDTALASYAQVWAAAGHPHAVFQTTFDELVTLTGGSPVDVA